MMGLICYDKDGKSQEPHSGGKRQLASSDFQKQPVQSGLASFWVYALRKEVPKMLVAAVASKCNKTERALSTFNV